MGAVIVAAIACAFGLLTIALRSDVSSALGGLLATGAFLFGAGYFGWYGIRLYLDLRAGVVSRIEGFVTATERETDVATRYGGKVPVWTYYWNVDGQKFAVIGKAYVALMPGPHRLYYLPRSRRVIAAEPI